MIFKEWKTMNERKTGKQVKMFRTGNGLEFSESDFNKFCANKGIVRHNVMIGMPQQNGVAEHMNRMLIERVRCMLSNAGLGKQF